MFNDRLGVHKNTRVKTKHTWHTHYHGHPQKGGENRCTPPPLIENQTIFFLLYGWPCSYFSPCGALLVRFSTYGGGGPFHHVRAFLFPFFHAGAFLLRFSTYLGTFSPCEGWSAPFFSM